MPILVVCLQIIYTLNSFNQIRYEELDNVVKNPYWFSLRFIFDGVSTNLAWYGFLSTLYSIFGFHLFLFKFIKIVFLIVSFYCLAAVLKKYLGTKLAILPFLAFSLSPTQFYFNILGVTNGTDLVFFPILLYLLLRINYRHNTSSFIIQILVWFGAILAWLTYSVFIFYLPILGLINLLKLKTQKKYLSSKKIFLILLVSFISFITPLVFILLYIKNRDLLIYDERLRSGLFRSGGVFKLDFTLFTENFGYLIENLFIVSNGYYNEIIEVEFSRLFPIISIIVIFYFSFKILLTNLKKEGLERYLKLIVLVCFTLLLVNPLIINFTDVLTPGLRRYTPMLASFYALFTVTWYYINTRKKKLKFIYWILTGILILIPLHHLLVYPANLKYLKQPSPFAFYKDAIIFNYPKPPQEMTDDLIKSSLRQELKFICLGQDKKPINCRYIELYTVVKSACLWNNLLCHKMYGYDIKQKRFIFLKPEVWLSRYFNE